MLSITLRLRHVRLVEAAKQDETLNPLTPSLQVVGGPVIQTRILAFGKVHLQRRDDAKRHVIPNGEQIGDLILTCYSLESRNMSFGKAFGEGQIMKEILTRRKTVAEGVRSAP